MNCNLDTVLNIYSLKHCFFLKYTIMYIIEECNIFKVSHFFERNHTLNVSIYLLSLILLVFHTKSTVLEQDKAV